MLLFFANLLPASQSLPLNGTWRFALDREDAGIDDRRFTKPLPDKIQLPGVLQSQGYGDEISTNTPWVLSLYDRNWFLRADYTNCTTPGDVKVPFVCQPPRHYLGAAWYQRDVVIPADWQGQRVVLFLERPHWESRVWVDGQLIGTNNSLCAPHEFELGTKLAPGQHTLTVRVDNRMILPYRPDAHSISDSLAQTWNGIVGKMELRATPPVWIDDVQVFPHIASKGITVRGKIGNLTGERGSAKLKLTAGPATDNQRPAAMVETVVEWVEQGGLFQAELTLPPSAEPWDEFHPNLCALQAELETDAKSRQSVTFGLRELKVNGTGWEVNGHPAYLRGTHSGGDFPLTGYPPTDAGYWRNLFTTCKEWGLNSMRFHSFCPPDAAFTAADELGFYLYIEPGMWNTFDPGTPMEMMLYAETKRIIRAYGNHPSFIMLSGSNEPKGHWTEVLPEWVEHCRTNDPRRLYTTASGFTDPNAPGPVDKVDFSTFGRIGRSQVRGVSGWFGGDYTKALTNFPAPILTHELGQWCAYPDFDVIKKFTGYMRPGNYEIYRDSAAKNGVLEQNHPFAQASGRFQLACYKEEIEANLRTPGLAGFQLLDLHDYVGQGTALVGLLDTFWESKGYATPAEFRKFCAPVVPLARLKQRVFTTADQFEVPVELANFSPAPLVGVPVRWQIQSAAGKAVAEGTFSVTNIPLGKNIPLGSIAADLSKLPAPAAYRLVVQLDLPASSGAVPPHNDWNFWVYPPAGEASPAADVLTTSSWDEAAAKLAEGGKVLFIPRAADLDWTCPPLDTVPVFWNRLMNPQWGRMIGLWCDTNHLALAGFPTEVNCDWQWTQILRGTRAVNLSALPRSLTPIVSAIDDWNRNWKLGVLFEARVGKGRLLVSAIDVRRHPSPVAKQLGRSLRAYMAGAMFQPRTEITPAQFTGLRFDNLVMRKLGAVAQADGEDAGAAIDGDPNTSWVVGVRGRGKNAPPAAPRPHTLTLTFTNAVALDGLVVLNRQNDRDHIGDVRQFSVQSSSDGTNWSEVVTGELASTWSPQKVSFGKTITATQLRFISRSGFGNDTATALAELAVSYVGPKLPDNSDEEVRYKRVRSTSTDVDEGAAQPEKPKR